MSMITTRSSLQTPKQTPGWKFNKFVSFETNIFPSDVLETAKIRTTNFDLGIPKKDISEGDHIARNTSRLMITRTLLKKRRMTLQTIV